MGTDVDASGTVARGTGGETLGTVVWGQAEKRWERWWLEQAGQLGQLWQLGQAEQPLSWLLKVRYTRLSM